MRCSHVSLRTRKTGYELFRSSTSPNPVARSAADASEKQDVVVRFFPPGGGIECNRHGAKRCAYCFITEQTFEGGSRADGSDAEDPPSLMQD